MEQLQYFTPGDSFRSGYDRGKEQARANRLRELTSAYLAAPQDQRQGFASQFAALDAGTGMDVATAERDRSMERLRAQAAFLGYASPQVQAGLYGAMRPQLAQLGIEAPEQFDPSLVEPIRSAAFGLGGQARVQSRFVGEDGMVYAMMSNSPIPIPTGVRGENLLTPETLTQNGVEVSGLIDRRAGEFRGFGAGGSGQMPQPAPAASGGMSIPVPGGQIDVADPAAAEFLRNNPSVMQGLSSGRPFTATGGAPARGGFITNDPVAQAGNIAAAQASGRIGAELAAAPAQAAASANLARLQELAKGEAGRENDRIANRTGLIIAMNQADQSTAAMRELVSTSIEPMISGWSTGTLGAFMTKVPGSQAADLEANLDTLKAVAGFSELTALKSRGGTLGAVSEMELQMLTSLWGALRQSQSPEAFRANLGRYMTRVEQAWQNVAAEYEFKYGESAPAATERLNSGPQGREVKRTGTLNGRAVVEYADGSVEYAD